MRKNSPDNFEWKKENQESKKGFDFDSFLRDDPVWGMEPDWQEDEEDFAPVETTAEIRDGGAAPAASQRGYQAPPRPEILVAEPGRARVVIKPERSYEEPVRRKKGMGAGGVIGIVVAVAVIVLIAFLFSGIFDSLGAGGKESPALPELSLPSASPAAEATPVPVATEPPAATEAPREEPEQEEPEEVYYSIRVTAGSGGSVIPGGETVVSAGSGMSFQILAEDGYELSQLLVDGVEQTLTELYYFDNVQSDHSIYAVFSKVVTPEPEPTPDPTPEPTPEPTEPPAEPETGGDASATDIE